jgi:predicted glycosyltransferase
MKIVVDINHPAHVHYFKNFIWEMQKRGHEILITASEKDISYTLLDNYGFSYVKIGNYGKSILQKMINIPVLDLKMYLAVRKFQSDLFLGFGSIRAAHVSKLMRKPYIAFDDSEPSPFEHLLYVPFADAILTPTSFKKNFGKRHYFYKGYIELCYLHPNYFSPDPSSLEILGENPDSHFVLMRFVAWNAMHDVGKKGFDLASKIHIVMEIAKQMNVYISSEGVLPKELEPYKIKIPPEKIHDIIYYSQMFIGDSQTMTTEAALLGTPAIRCNSFVGEQDMGNFIELERDYGLIFNYSDPKLVLDKALALLKEPRLKLNWAEKRKVLLKDKIDVTSLMVWVVEKYPQIFTELWDHPEFQGRFASDIGVL